jgi:DNA-binding XRE family transcriptional regulator
VDTFAKFPQYTLSLPQPIIKPRGYTLSTKTVGDHIRKKRLDLGLQQHEVAEAIGVTESTIWNWEHGTKPLAKYLPKIIKFLGNI